MPQWDSAHLWLTLFEAEDAKSSCKWRQPEGSWKISCLTCPEMILGCSGHPKMDREGGRKELQAPAYPLCLSAACELPGPWRNPSNESNHCTIHWSHVQFDGTLILWHMKGFLPRGASGYGLFIFLAIAFSRPRQG